MSTRIRRWPAVSPPRESPGPSPHFHAANWHPLTWLSHMLDCQLYGLNHPGGHHLTNVLLHAASAILLFLVLRQMTGDLWPSAFVAALFAVHPLHVESVAWVAERKDVLSGLFFMLTLAAYVGLRPASVFASPLPAGDGPVCPGPDGQADAGDAALRVAAVGLLAAGEGIRGAGAGGNALRRRSARQILVPSMERHGERSLQRGSPSHFPATGPGKAAMVRAGGRLLRDNVCGPGERSRRGAARAAAVADRQCPGFLCRISGSVLLSHGPGRVLSSSGKPPAHLEDRRLSDCCWSAFPWQSGLAAGDARICWLAGCGIWGCSCP